MTTAVAPPPAPAARRAPDPAPPPPAAPLAAATPTQPFAPRTRPTAEDWWRSLGCVPLHRILLDPPPGTATVDDVIRLSHHENRGVELVNGTLVEKPVGYFDSAVGINISTALHNWAKPQRRGVVTGEQGMITMSMGNIRIPDVAFVRREDFPEGGPNRADPAPRLAPTVAVEVLSPSNTAAEIDLKLREYFESGTRLAWVFDPGPRTVRVHDAPERFRQLTADDALDGGDVLPGFSVRVGELFEVD